MRILFNSADTVFKKPFGAVREDESCNLAIHIPKCCFSTDVRVILSEDESAKELSFPLSPSGGYGGYDIFSGDVCVPKSGLYFYHFRITAATGTFSLFREKNGQTNMEAGEKWQLTVMPANYRVPTFFRGKMMYQIFPDRFFKGKEHDLSEKLTPFTVHADMKDVPDYAPDENGEVKNLDFYGGDFAGIEEKLPYIRSLGAEVVYLNPIFKAYSNHRYDTADYMKLDEMLGTEEDFKSMCRAAHELGIKIVLDGVFSHTGADSVYFDANKRFGNGAASCESSPYRSWYIFRQYPDDYECWWNMKTLPCVRETEESFQRHIFDDVVPKWIGLGADGFRLDVADELPDEFIAKLREKLKALKPDAILIGEVWEDASNKISYGKRRGYFTRGELDGVMNYPFRNAIFGFVSGELNASGFTDAVMSIAENYPFDALLSSMCMLSTHDTPRIISLLGTKPPNEKGARAFFRMEKDDYAAAEKAVCAALMLQFALPGMPCVYYGDEIGMEGFEDPFCRGFFDWEKSSPLTEVIRKAATLRREYPALAHGGIFVRQYAEGTVTITRGEGDAAIRVTVAQRDGVRYEPFGKVVYSKGFTAGIFEKYGICIEKHS